MNERLKKIPVIGRLAMILSAVYHSPERFENLREAADELSRRADGADRRADMEAERLNRVEGGEKEMMLNIAKGICRNREALGTLNLNLSTHPVIWGDEEKLKISPKASVTSCFFNVNSGTVTIGDYTFAGSGVSILTGSHDVNLGGFLRRDAEITEGNDIVIGSGVWLASECVILGPCTIGDNAVIAAGAVVTPGTRVPEKTVFGGVPAKKIADLDIPDEFRKDDPAVVRAVKRNGGALFVSGWSEKKKGLPGTRGHWLEAEEGTVLTGRSEWKLVYRLEGAENCRLAARGPAGEKEYTLEGGDGETEISLPVKTGTADLVYFRLLTDGAEILMSLTEPEEQEGRTCD